jgi:hypothetical protein
MCLARLRFSNDAKMATHSLPPTPMGQPVSDGKSAPTRTLCGQARWPRRGGLLGDRRAGIGELGVPTVLSRQPLNVVSLAPPARFADDRQDRATDLREGLHAIAGHDGEQHTGERSRLRAAAKAALRLCLRCSQFTAMASQGDVGPVLKRPVMSTSFRVIVVARGAPGNPSTHRAPTPRLRLRRDR